LPERLPPEHEATDVSVSTTLDEVLCLAGAAPVAARA
jgi:hypothetical protein